MGKKADGLERFKRETRQRLQQEMERIEGLKKGIERSTFSGDQEDVYGELTTTSDIHPADYGTETHFRELDLTIKQMIEEREKEIQRALSHLAHDQYGICEVCGQPIDPERLKARPAATLCIYHQRQKELSKPRYGYGDRGYGDADVSSVLGIEEEEEYEH